MAHYFNLATIKTLHIDLDYLEYRDAYDCESLSRFSAVEKLGVDCSGTSYMFPFLPIASLDQNQRIKHLSLTNNIDRAIDPRTFCTLMQHFPQLLSLEIGMWDQENVINIGDWDDRDIIKLFPNLEALCLTKDASCEIADPLIKVLGHKLKHVTLSVGSNASSDKGWGELLELRLYNGSRTALSNITKTARNIQKLHFTYLLHDVDVACPSGYIQLLSMHNNLTYLSIRVTGFKNVDLVPLISALNLAHERGLKIALCLYVDVASLIHKKIHDGKYCLEMKPETENVKKQLYAWIKNVATASQTATHNTFMLIVDIKLSIPVHDHDYKFRYPTKEFESQLTKDIGDTMKELELENCSVRFDDNYLMIKSNKYRMYGGYHEKWMVD
eukprot:922207_1